MTNPAAFLAAVRAEHHSAAAEDPEPGETTFWCDTCDEEAPCLTELLARAVEAVWILTCDASTMELRPLPNYRPIQATDIRQAITDALSGGER